MAVAVLLATLRTVVDFECVSGLELAEAVLLELAVSSQVARVQIGVTSQLMSRSMLPVEGEHSVLLIVVLLVSADFVAQAALEV